MAHQTKGHAAYARFNDLVGELDYPMLIATVAARDGTRAGYDIALTRAIADAVPVPVIASGGAGNLDHSPTQRSGAENLGPACRSVGRDRDAVVEGAAGIDADPPEIARAQGHGRECMGGLSRARRGRDPWSLRRCPGEQG